KKTGIRTPRGAAAGAIASSLFHNESKALETAGTLTIPAPADTVATSVPDGGTLDHALMPAEQPTMPPASMRLNNNVGRLGRVRRGPVIPPRLFMQGARCPPRPTPVSRLPRLKFHAGNMATLWPNWGRSNSDRKFQVLRGRHSLHCLQKGEVPDVQLGEETHRFGRGEPLEIGRVMRPIEMGQLDRLPAEGGTQARHQGIGHVRRAQHPALVL